MCQLDLFFVFFICCAASSSLDRFLSFDEEGVLLVEEKEEEEGDDEAGDVEAWSCGSDGKGMVVVVVLPASCRGAEDSTRTER